MKKVTKWKKSLAVLMVVTLISSMLPMSTVQAAVGDYEPEEMDYESDLLAMEEMDDESNQLAIEEMDYESDLLAMEEMDDESNQLAIEEMDDESDLLTMEEMDDESDQLTSEDVKDVNELSDGEEDPEEELEEPLAGFVAIEQIHDVWMDDAARDAAIEAGTYDGNDFLGCEVDEGWNWSNIVGCDLNGGRYIFGWINPEDSETDLGKDYKDILLSAKDMQTAYKNGDLEVLYYPSWESLFPDEETSEVEDGKEITYQSGLVEISPLSYSYGTYVPEGSDEEAGISTKEYPKVTSISFSTTGIYVLTYQESSITIDVGYPILAAYSDMEKAKENFLGEEIRYKDKYDFYLISNSFGESVSLGAKKIDEYDLDSDVWVVWDNWDKGFPAITDGSVSIVPVATESEDGTKIWKVSIAASKIAEKDFGIRIPYTVTGSDDENEWEWSDSLFLNLKRVSSGFAVITNINEIWMSDEEYQAAIDRGKEIYTGFIGCEPGEYAEWEKYVVSDLYGSRCYFGEIAEDASARSYAEDSISYEKLIDGLQVHYQEDSEAEVKEVTSWDDYLCIDQATNGYDAPNEDGEMEWVEEPIEKVIRVQFFKTGIYTLTYNDSNVIFEVRYPDFAAYVAENKSAENFICNDLEFAETPFEVYLITNIEDERSAMLGVQGDLWGHEASEDIWVYEEIDGGNLVEPAEGMVQIEEVKGATEEDANLVYKVTIAPSFIERNDCNLVFPYTVYNQSGDVEYKEGIHLNLHQSNTQGLFYKWDLEEDYQSKRFENAEVNSSAEVFLLMYEDSVPVPVTKLEDLDYYEDYISVEAGDRDGYGLKDGFVSITFKKVGTTYLTYQGSSIKFVISDPMIRVAYDEDYEDTLPMFYENYSWDFANDSVYVHIGNDQVKIQNVEFSDLPRGTSLIDLGENTYQIHIDSYLALNMWQRINCDVEYQDGDHKEWQHFVIEFDQNAQRYERPQYTFGPEGSNYSGAYLYTDSWIDLATGEECFFSEYEDGMCWNGFPTYEMAAEYPIYWFNDDTLQGVINLMNGSVTDTIEFDWGIDPNRDEYEGDQLVKYISEMIAPDCSIQPSVTDYTVLEDEYIYSSGCFDRIRVSFGGNVARLNDETWEDEDGEIHKERIYAAIYKLNDSAAEIINSITGEETTKAGDYVSITDWNAVNDYAQICFAEPVEPTKEAPYRFNQGELIIDDGTFQENMDILYGNGSVDLEDEIETLFETLTVNNCQEGIAISFPELHINADCEYNFTGWFNNYVYFAMGTNTDYTFNVVTSTDEGEELITYRYSDIHGLDRELPEYIVFDHQFVSIKNPIVLTEQVVTVDDVKGSYVDAVNDLAEGERLISVSQDTIPDISGLEAVTMSEEQMKALEEDGAKIDVALNINTVDAADTSLSTDTKADIANISAELNALNKELSEAEAFKTGLILDFVVNASVKDKKGNTIAFDEKRNNVKSDGTIQIKELFHPMLLKVKLPKELRSKTMTYKIVCVHDGESYVLEGKNVDGYLIFEADRFSTYAILVNGEPEKTPDVKPDPIPENPDHKHIGTHVEAKAATCTETGNKEYWYCSGCKKYFSKESMAADSEVTLNAVTVSANGHKIVKVDAVSATCEKDGAKEYYKCSACDSMCSDLEFTKPIKAEDIVIKASGHAWDDGVVTKDPTVKEEGTITYTCKNDKTHVKTESIPMLPKPVVEATATVKADGTYELNKVTVPENLEYDGTAPVIPTVITVPDVSGNAITLAEGTDYKVTYKNNKIAGTMTMTIKGTGEYAGKLYKEVSVKIATRDLTDEFRSGVVIPNLVFTAMQAGKVKANPVVTYNGKKLKLNKDYEIYVSGNKYNGKDKLDVSVTEIIVKGIGNYSGQRKISVSYLKEDDARIPMSKVSVKGVKGQLYLGNAVTLDDAFKNGTIVVKAGSTPLEYNKDYTVSYYNNSRVGTATMVISAVEGSENYVGSKTVNFKLSGTKISSADVVLTYGGKVISTKKGETVTVLSPATAIIPEIKVTVNGKVLTEGEDYVVSISKNRKPGTATVAITGIDGFTGTKKVKFKITK